MNQPIKTQDFQFEAQQRTVVKVAIVVPVFKHPGLLPETLTSALAQETEFGFAVILVNDGCPFPETHETCEAFTARYPTNVFYIRKKNGGLSSARNAGINFALAAFPALEAVYLLDADNIIGSRLLQRSYDALCRAPKETAWIYPDIDKFGIEDFACVSGPYRVLEHLCWNFCEAGSLIRASVLAEGLRYDEGMKAGYEDWEFWLQCISRGYVGEHLPASGFHYRQRAESMLKDSERQHESIMGYIRVKHKSLFSVSSVLRFEEKEHKRFAIYCPDSGMLYYATDPCHEMRVVGLEFFSKAFWKSVLEPGFLDVPPLLVIASERAVSFLKEFGLLNGALWELQRRCGERPSASLSIACEAADVPEVRFQTGGQLEGPAHLLMVRMSRLRERLGDQGIRSEGLDALLPEAWPVRLTFRLPFDLPSLLMLDGALEKLRLAINSLGATISAMGVRHTEVQRQRAKLSDCTVYSRMVAEVAHPLPIFKDGARDVGLLLPVLSFGGVEKVALAYAKAIVSRGAKVHLFICGRNSVASLADDIVKTASTITFFGDRGIGSYAPSVEGRDYLGAPLSRWSDMGDVESALGLLSAMDAVINFNVSEFNALMAKLRRMGIRTATSQHLVDMTPFAQPQGTPHQILAFEHAYDDVIVISRKLADWCLGMGIPREKLVLVPNSPGYDVDEKTCNRIVSRKLDRKAGPLRVLFMGRFDRQKGLDRLSELILRCEAQQLGIDWRIVGKEILGDEAVDLSAVRKHIWPVATTPRTLTLHYGWADVMILPSRFEGVPLSILEAGRLGCVVIATDVGAVDEILRQGETGFLIDSNQTDQGIVADMIDVLQELIADDGKRREICEAVSADYRRFAWSVTCAPLLSRLKI